METLFNNLVVLLIVVDPLGVSAMFAALTHGAGRPYQRRMAIRGTALAGAILVAFFLVGEWLLEALGVGLPAFRVAGGILLFLLAIDMVMARQTGLRSTTDAETDVALHKQDVSVFPLAFPLLAGPGAMTTTLLMTPDATSPMMTAGLLAVLALVMGVTLLCLLQAPLIARLLGETGVNVINRLLGLILAALAVQYVMDGLSEGLALRLAA